MSSIRLASFLAVFFIGSLGNFQIFAASFSGEKAQMLARQAVSENAETSHKAVEKLRGMEAEGLKTLLEVYAAEIKNHFDGKDSADWEQISAALDRVAMQKNVFASGLYWYTDFAKAKEIAQREHKPILSLRLLGNLNEELSCANSRFFRTVLYPNAEISKALRERFVLHWQSVRPAPRITIDFGDGRKIERTVTGNSIHYLLNSDGEALDALPGLYSPAAFTSWLNEGQEVFQKYNELSEYLRPDFLRQYHRLNHEKIERQWNRDLAKVSAGAADKLTDERAAVELSEQNLLAVSATRAANNAIGKKAVEFPSVRETALPSTEKLLALEKETDISEWQKIAGLYPNNSQLDANSLVLMRLQTKSSATDFAKLINNFAGYLAVDTIRNEYVYRSKLHEWLASSPALDLDKLNDRVYASLFLTPKSDDWLGLYSPEIYAALDGNGLK